MNRPVGLGRRTSRQLGPAGAPEERPRRAGAGTVRSTAGPAALASGAEPFDHPEHRPAGDPSGHRGLRCDAEPGRAERGRATGGGRSRFDRRVRRGAPGRRARRSSGSADPHPRAHRRSFRGVLRAVALSFSEGTPSTLEPSPRRHPCTPQHQSSTSGPGGNLERPGRLAQRESTALTTQGSAVRTRHRPP